ncbi:MAG: GTP cyclohydrolase I FolE [Spiribacter sp.]|jgi:GTP cyclohydrolase I (EC 3.5.4.16)|nr:GTP cyclohydrolase I FolE [Spiribacter sp.]MDR9489957.1 GTP cyclohydrolase I FolE [Spiribacter sp.]
MNPDLDYHYEQIIRGLGEDVEREGLVKTPYRAARAMEYLTEGYHQSLDDIVNDALFESDSDEMVIVRDIEFYSLCEHHVLPFIGHAQVGYIPNGKVIGLSKIARIVDMYARRLQIQEKLVRDVANAIQEATGALGVAVQMDARHLCMMMRGVSKQNAEMSSSVMLGTFRSSESARNEFLQLIRRRAA